MQAVTVVVVEIFTYYGESDVISSGVPRHQEKDAHGPAG